MMESQTQDTGDSQAILITQQAFLAIEASIREAFFENFLCDRATMHALLCGTGEGLQRSSVSMAILFDAEFRRRSLILDEEQSEMQLMLEPVRDLSRCMLDMRSVSASAFAVHRWFLDSDARAP